MNVHIELIGESQFAVILKIINSTVWGSTGYILDVEFLVIVAILLLSKVYFWPISAVKFCGKVMFVTIGIE